MNNKEEIKSSGNNKIEKKMGGDSDGGPNVKRGTFGSKKNGKEIFNGKKSKGIKIKINKTGIKNIVGLFAGKLNKMLNEDINESVEIGTKKVGNVKVNYGVRLKFPDNKKKEINYIKKKRSKN
jgi:hypothetical protein